MNTSIHKWLQLVKPDMKIFLWVSLGIFLFILFFQPFSLENFDFNNRLLVVAGLGGIIFLLMVITRSFFPFQKSLTTKGVHTQTLPGLYSSLILLAFGAVAFAFYLRYVAHVEITFFVMFKVIFICMVPPVSLRLCDVFRELRNENQRLKPSTDTRAEKPDPGDNNLSQPIEFTSENSTENLVLRAEDTVFIKSADNYVEVAYRDKDETKTILLRNTLKKVEIQLKTYPEFIRCHRICIVNMHHVQNLVSKNQNHWLKLTGYAEQIPVSRQYLLKVKEGL
jgi:DNA-binding LytR/AlgR family response regulator